MFNLYLKKIFIFNYIKVCFNFSLDFNLIFVNDNFTIFSKRTIFQLLTTYNLEVVYSMFNLFYWIIILFLILNFFLIF